MFSNALTAVKKDSTFKNFTIHIHTLLVLLPLVKFYLKELIISSMSLLYNLHFLTCGNPGRAHLFALLLTFVEGFSKGDTIFYLTSPTVCLHGGPKQRTKEQLQPRALRWAGLAEIERPELDLYDLPEPTHCWICGYSRRTLSGQHL